MLAVAHGARGIMSGVPRVKRAWQYQPVFVSGTFRDMHAERDYLRSHVFPELAERLSTRQISVEAVDLRWGVDTSVAEVDHDLIVLKVCLGEVKRCLPFFIGIIGDRYGSILPDPRLEDAAVEAGLNTRVVGKSVTDLEIEFAALTRPHNARSAYFYLREPLP